MVMDGDFRINIDEVIRNVETAEVFSIFFPILRKSIVFDCRATLETPPMVKILPMVGSIEERLRSIRRLRGNFPALESMTVIPWPRRVESLVRLGIWDRIIQRLVDSGYKETVKACVKALEDLKRLEIEEMAAVIRGDNYHTLWPRRG